MVNETKSNWLLFRSKCLSDLPSSPGDFTIHCNSARDILADKRNTRSHPHLLITPVYENPEHLVSIANQKRKEALLNPVVESSSDSPSPSSTHDSNLSLEHELLIDLSDSGLFFIDKGKLH